MCVVKKSVFPYSNTNVLIRLAQSDQQISHELFRKYKMVFKLTFCDVVYSYLKSTYWFETRLLSNSKGRFSDAVVAFYILPFLTLERKLS